jgi:hypothetical protein
MHVPSGIHKRVHSIVAEYVADADSPSTGVGNASHQHNSGDLYLVYGLPEIRRRCCID